MHLLSAFLILSFLVFFHELGHFLIARVFGVRVEVFSIGFGTKILSKKIGNTLYALSLIPLGGYVKLKGQNDLDTRREQSEDNDSYSTKPPFVKILILFAGPLFNFILAFILFVCVAKIGFNTYLPIIGEVKKDMPAFEAGILKGDRVIEANSKKINTWNDLSQMVSKGELLHLKILRDDRILEFDILPSMQESVNIFNEKINKGLIGILPKNEIGIVRFDFLDSLIYGYEQVFQSSKMILLGVQKLIVGIVPLKEVGGPIMIVDRIAQASQEGFVLLLLWVGLISVNLGILNLFPIPALDGGQIIFNLYEMITRKKIGEKMKYYLTLTGWLILLSLMFLGLRNDIMRLINP
ncbi:MULTISPECIES: RIP metalloprotease RseP [unclassified Helicobacter]|uniref:RIP metalloprotease RseP n=1 Tax=unclassified Helicobacter TaxID=2593540 RepID=UPI000CF1512D|nr:MULTISPECIES: RIP metalloprotease RseP [unclassified Helicobacter]